jgi:hypothetical protein
MNPRESPPDHLPYTLFTARSRLTMGATLAWPRQCPEKPPSSGPRFGRLGECPEPTIPKNRTLDPFKMMLLLLIMGCEGTPCASSCLARYGRTRWHRWTRAEALREPRLSVRRKGGCFLLGLCGRTRTCSKNACSQPAMIPHGALPPCSVTGRSRSAGANQTPW